MGPRLKKCGASDLDEEISESINALNEDGSSPLMLAVVRQDVD